MSAGTINDDLRVTVVTSNPTVVVTGIGSWYKKTWSGTNGPKIRNRTSPTPHEPRRVKREKRGEHAYSMSLESGVVSLLRTHTWTKTAGVLVGNPTSGWSSNDDLNLILDLRSKMHGSDFDMSIFLGTSHQSLRMIGDTAIQLAQALRAIRKGDMAGAARGLTGGAGRHKKRPAPRTVDEMSKRTLELRYGWLPLLQDLHDGAEFVAEQLNFPMVQRYRVSKIKDQLPPKFVNGPTTSVGWKRVGLIAIVKENPSMIAKLGLTSPSNLAWELLPWSFVVDWALPIGDYLQARSFAGSLTGTFIRSTKTFGFQTGQVYNQTGPSINIVIPPGYNYVKRVTFQRDILTSLPVPLPSVKPMNKVASMAHAINGVALLAQQGLKIANSFKR